MKYVLLIGSVSNGHHFFGPFDTEDAAQEWSNKVSKNEGDVVTVDRLKHPVEQEANWEQIRRNQEKKR